jgi:hypothetical protein
MHDHPTACVITQQYSSSTIISLRLHSLKEKFGSRLFFYFIFLGTAAAQWLRCCATNRKVAGSIPAGVIGIFH